MDSLTIVFISYGSSTGKKHGPYLPSGRLGLLLLEILSCLKAALEAWKDLMAERVRRRDSSVAVVVDDILGGLGVGNSGKMAMLSISIYQILSSSYVFST